MHDVEYNKRFVRPYSCGGFVYSPSKGVSTDNLVVALIKEIMLLLDQKLLTTTDDVSALFPKRTPQDRREDLTVNKGQTTRNII